MSVRACTRYAKATGRLALFLILLLGATTGGAAEPGGFLAVEGRLFPRPPAAAGQAHHDATLVLQPELYGQWPGGWRAAAVLFGRVGGPDGERNHWDLRECSIARSGGAWEIEFGLGRVFWGATEFVHLVDIVNQTDLVEDIDAEEKLGQPMMRLTLERPWATVDLFVLPYFRERTFAGRAGRLRGDLVVATDRPLYENRHGKHHVDYAVRASRTVGMTDIGIGLFVGTGRDPLLLPRPAIPQPILVPYYEQIRQVSVDLQTAAGDWLWKFEGLYRHAPSGHFSAATGGFEYTLYGVGGTPTDVGLLLEYAWDQRDRQRAVSQDGDIMIGLRLAANDPASTGLLIGAGLDTAGGASFLRLEGERRLGDQWKVVLEGTFFFAGSTDDPLAALADDDFLRLQLRRYF